MNWVTVEIGPPWRVELMWTALEEQGIPAFIPDRNLKTIDPFITAPLSLDCHLQVPEEHAAEAREVLDEVASLQEESPPEDQLQHEPGISQDIDAANDEDHEARETARLADIGKRIQWATLLVVTQVFVFYYAFQYYRELRKTDARPAGHRITVAAIVFVALTWGLVAFGILSGRAFRGG